MKYMVVVTEEVTVRYPAVEIEADSRDEAADIAEDMRCQGLLGNPHEHESVDDIGYEVTIAGVRYTKVECKSSLN